jgi:hypothetical protein
MICCLFCGIVVATIDCGNRVATVKFQREEPGEDIPSSLNANPIKGILSSYN